MLLYGRVYFGRILDGCVENLHTIHIFQSDETSFWRGIISIAAAANREMGRFFRALTMDIASSVCIAFDEHYEIVLRSRIQFSPSLSHSTLANQCKRKHFKSARFFLAPAWFQLLFGLICNGFLAHQLTLHLFRLNGVTSFWWIVLVSNSAAAALLEPKTFRK